MSLAAPGRSQEREELAVLDMLGKPGDNRQAAVPFDDLIDMNRNTHALPSPIS